MLKTLESSAVVSPLVLVAITIASCLFVLLTSRKANRGKNIPRGSLGFPVIGESIGFLRAQSRDCGEEWVHQRVLKFGPVFKTSLIGCPTVIITGNAGNKFILGSDYEVLMTKHPKSISILGGEQSFVRRSKTRYRLVKAAMVSFLNPESIRCHIKDMDSVIMSRILRETRNKSMVQCVNFMKKVMFDVSCTILFGIHDDHTKEALLEDFLIMSKAFWSIPINFPGTTFRKGIDARQRIIKRMLRIIETKREDLRKGTLSPKSDVISCLLSLEGEENEGPITEMEIIDNGIVLMAASHDTSATVSTLMIWKMARDEEIYKSIKKEQQGIIREDKLTWEEIQKMKYTWRVALELMRIHPPIFGNFRKTSADLNFEGYDIPKGWQVFWAACGTHMDEKIFQDPTRFDPSRFEPETKRIPPYAYIPFGGGTHLCIGIEFGKFQTLTTIHHMVTKFEWVQLHPEEKLTRQPVPVPSMGLPLLIKPIN